MSKKQDYYNKANSNKKQAIEALEKEVDNTLPWQNEGLVEEDITEQPAEETEPVVEITDDKPLPESVVTEESTHVSSSVNISELRTQLTTLGNVILEGILKYMDEMKPRKVISAKRGGVLQAALFNNLKVMFNKLDVNEFNLLYKNVLLLVNEHKDGVFADSHVFRFYEEWVLSEEDRKGFMSLMTLMLITCDPKTRRQSLRTIKNWNHVLANSLTNDAKTKIKNFYNINI